MVSLTIARINIEKSHILHTDSIYVLWMSLRTNNLLAKYSLVFIMETKCVYGAVRTEFLCHAK